MGAAENTLYLSAASILLSVLTVAVNGYVVIGFVVKKQSAGLKHFSMLIVKMVFDSFFALATVVYSTSVILQLQDIHLGTGVLYQSGNVIQSLEAAMSILIVFVAADRLCAMRKPLHYSRRYGALIQKVAIGVLCATFTACFLAYAATRPASNSQKGYVFTQLVNRLTQSIIHLSTVAVLVFGLLVTAIFVREFQKFTRRRSTGQMTSYNKSAKSANRVVLYLMAIEFVCLIVPNTSELVLRVFFDIRMGNFGPVIHPLFVLYITISSVMFLTSTVSKAGSTPNSTVQAVQSTRWTGGGTS